MGLAILVATAWLLLAETADWVSPEAADPWINRGAVLGLAALGVGILFRILAPVGRGIRRERCERCGAPVGLGQKLCRDHLKATLNEMRDRNREALQQQGGSRRSGCSSS
jgi:hypothetical protein